MGDNGAGTAAAQLAEIDLLRRRVLSVVGHELRTPVTTLRGLVEVLDEVGGDPDRTIEVHAALRRAARRVEALLDDALVALGVSTALPVGDPSPTPVAAAVTEAWQSLDTAALPPSIVGDAVALAHPRGLRTALRAVLDNATKYGAADAEPIAVRIDGAADEVVVEVADRGQGVPDAEAGLLFEPFFRTERAVMSAAGLGLGLAVTRRLIEHDGGSVDLQTSEGHGTVVAIRLPRAAA